MNSSALFQMAPRDPMADIEPNFESDSWNTTREVMVNQGLLAEQATEILRQSWKAQHEKDIEAWNKHLQQPQPEEKPPQDPLMMGNLSGFPHPVSWTINPHDISLRNSKRKNMSNCGISQHKAAKTQPLSTSQLPMTPSAWSTPTKGLCSRQLQQWPCHWKWYKMSSCPGTNSWKEGEGCWSVWKPMVGRMPKSRNLPHSL